jgi:hypothetical protein
MATENKAGLYEVGYGKPPQSTRFRKGKSGNPGGLPKGQPNISAALVRFLAMPPRILHNFKPRSVAEELAKKVIDTALNGKATVALRALVWITDRVEGKVGTCNRVEYPNGHTDYFYEGDWQPPQIEFERGDTFDEEREVLIPAGYVDEEATATSDEIGAKTA